MKTFKEYEELAVSTAIYPGQGTPLGLIYCTLKLTGEAGEFSEHVGKACRDDGFLSLITQEEDDSMWASLDGELTVARYELLIKEAGNVLWYIAAIARELGVTLEELASANIAKLSSRKARGTLGGSGDNR